MNYQRRIRALARERGEVWIQYVPPGPPQQRFRATSRNRPCAKIRNGTTRKRVRAAFAWWASRANKAERSPFGRL